MTEHAGYSATRAAAFAVVVLAMSGALSIPAALYWWRNPELATALSLLFTLGFFSCIFILARKASVSLLIGLPALGLNLIEIVHILHFGGLVSLGGLEAVLYVDPNEAREFAGDHAGAFFLGFAAIAAFCGLAIAKARLDTLTIRQRMSFVLMGLSVPLALLLGDLVAFGSKRDVYLPTRILEHYTALLGANPLSHTISGLATTLAGRIDLAREERDRAQYQFHATRAAPPAAEELYIVVIGESARRRNFSLYGYARPTNPRLSALPNLVVYRDAVSPATMTSNSLPLSFSRPAGPGRYDLTKRTRSFVSVFRDVGFKTYWITNQGTHRSAVGNRIAEMMSDAEVERSTNYGFWHTVLDEALLPELDRALRDPAPRKLIVLHTLGSHTNYRQRYPEAWQTQPFALPARQVHTNRDIDAAESSVVDDYDRSIMYTDWVLGEIVRRHAATGQYGAVIYLSDHGQRLYDDRRKQKGHGFGDFTSRDIEVPLLVWTSDAFNTQSPDKRHGIEANAALPVSTTGLFASMLDLAGIAADGVARSDSFFSGTHIDNPRQVLTMDDEVIEYAVQRRRPLAAQPAAGPVQTAHHGD